jgi:serine/threonine protein kinase
MVMEYCGQGDLFHWSELDKDEVIEDEVAEIIFDLMKTLKFLESQKIVHRDIKPENIMWGDDGRIRLTDFGISSQGRNKKTENIFGSMPYMSPESLKGEFSLKSDIWAAGCVLYQLVTGKKPFKKTNPHELQK